MRADLREGDLRLPGEEVIDLVGEGHRVDPAVGEQCGEIRVNRIEHLIDTDRRRAGRVGKAAFHRERDVRRSGGDRGEQPDWRPIADGNCVLLDHAQDLDDAPVLEPRLVVDEATQLRSERRHRSLRVVPGVEPVVMDAPNASVRAQRRDRCQRCDTTKSLGQLVLVGDGAEDLPERPEAGALVRRRDHVALAEHVAEQLALRAVPLRNALPYVAIECAEVLFNLAEVREELARERDELLEALGDRSVIEEANVARFDASDLFIDCPPTPMEILEVDVDISIGADVELSQQLDGGA